MQRMKFATLRTIIVAVCVTLCMGRDTGWLVAGLICEFIDYHDIKLQFIDSDKIMHVQMSRSETISLTWLATTLVKVWHTQDRYTAISVTYYNIYHLTGQDNCWKNWIRCAGKVAACGTECMNDTTSQSCITCLAPLYTECKSCFSEIEESQKSGNECNTLQSAQLEYISQQNIARPMHAQNF